MKIRNLALFLLAITASVSATAADLSIFGLELGKPFTLTECSFKRISKTLNFYNENDSVVCFKQTSDSDVGKGINPREATVYVRWPRGHEPELVTAYSLLAGVIDGNLESIGFNTLGVVSQDRDMNALKEKFGAPTQGGQSVAQNGYGAKAQIINAAWRIDDLSVYFNSAEHGFNKGFVHIQTDKAIASTKALLDQMHASRQKL